MLASSICVYLQIGNFRYLCLFSIKLLLRSQAPSQAPSACKFIRLNHYFQFISTQTNRFNLYLFWFDRQIFSLIHSVLFLLFIKPVALVINSFKLIPCISSLELTPEQQKLLIELRRKKQELLLEIQVSAIFINFLYERFYFVDYQVEHPCIYTVYLSFNQSNGRLNIHKLPQNCSFRCGKNLFSTSLQSPLTSTYLRHQCCWCCCLVLLLRCR